jgi:hypothetical protein
MVSVDLDKVVAAEDDAGERWSDLKASLSAAMLKMATLTADIPHGSGFHANTSTAVGTKW